MPFFRVTFRTQSGPLVQVFEAKSRAIAEQASRRACVPGCGIGSVVEVDGPESPEAPTVLVPGDPVGPSPNQALQRTAGVRPSFLDRLFSRRR